MLKVVDLFAGVGGMSLGAARAGFQLAGAVELDPIAIETHKVNFSSTKHFQCDISKLSSRDITDELKLKPSQLDGIIGGPPCQGFSSMGKRNADDPRNSLFLHFFRLVNEIEPKFFVAENVPGILDSKYDEIRNIAFSLVSKKYTLISPITISAKDVGVPTIRTRVFFIGFNKNYFKNPELNLFSPDERKFNYVRDGLLGLPEELHTNQYAWTEIQKGDKGSYSDILSNNFPTDVGNIEAIERYLMRSEVTGIIGTSHTPEVIERFMRVKQGEVDRVSKAPRLKLDGFCPTLRAGTGRDRGSYQAVRPIHPTENRVITPREAARLQGFPDWFQFHKTKWHSFRQIGNSVSPLVSEYVMTKILKEFS